MRTLAIDTSTVSMSIALIEDQTTKMEITTNTKIKHSKALLPLIKQLFTTVAWEVKDLDRVIVTRGPGSYTGLRIGVTTAKTLAWTLNIPLYSVTSLEAIAANAAVEDGIICPLINARRQTVFAMAYDSKGQALGGLNLGHYRLADWLNQLKAAYPTVPLYFISTDIDQFQETIQEYLGDQAQLLPAEKGVIHAPSLVNLALQKEDVATFLPEYAKLAEAEERWEEKHPQEAQANRGHYVERML
ncbi:MULTISPECIES: tRNA (adenosine(37)-N6)-threonylcarbamoyltransferase complex dimerization subunit type 1 TsaB [Aerococcus]|uniref:tRNA (adenosine(37)-N6)-threonylcarbamoyltransferase complex dimerization subunit type 1 TsaB n=1 Tax=Aerococcus urinae (strain CCUG 59500 / ACS-120-V-Col10a) TaxID=2976812 RepID=UPI000200F3D2|nr:tRNA (adenosine(37)-N6)-threonylcarbamoyltransferase complex dimerization subunit type 1 TsaB [Aerococcus sp. Group 1]AEA01004.1 universal bacterial protein YeaZ [Aerococcus sp. Group 1]MCY3031580.1 tRNA (adenosine(37)-N6)-threonylcarbamoyltransferase complex dimerization subunit type 1 TsaB [Aerococcus sp. Group 1]MCY3055656.1 tRNA (adenosine(37)-N6)-threonylcarbamoyltransferase complex dimerization subunit type 1 TsaB [Aerococcus sp. Group 1]MCY3057386.1 tRNA (adenosine(37)-N6)-threonylcar